MHGHAGILDTGTFAGEVSWKFQGDEGGAPGGGDYVVEHGMEYSLTLIDSYGDGVERKRLPVAKRSR